MAFQGIRRVFSRKSRDGGVKTPCGGGEIRSGDQKYAVAANGLTFDNAKCRNRRYPQSENAERFQVPDEKVSWNVAWSEYQPVEYTAPTVSKGPVWADADKTSGLFTWNARDGKVNRKSFVKDYEVVDGAPRNPIGRTGLVGRGLLGKWGPNHAADPIVTRWKRDSTGNKVLNSKTKRPILQFVSIQRKDSGEWALPGGMVDDDEEVSLTLKREFGEEALNSLEMNDGEKSKFDKEVKAFFRKGHEVYRGYVDDPRNTDNSWMETVAVNFHDDDGSRIGRFPLNAGDDAGAVAWVDIYAGMKLYASHSEFVKRVAEFRNAHWE